MTRVVVPEGLTASTTASLLIDPLVGNRSTRYVFDVLDSTGKKFGELDGVDTGTVQWSSNSAIQGGGKITVSKANDIHKRDIRVSVTRPVVAERDFSAGIGGFVGNNEFTSWMTGPKSITRNPSTYFDGVASLDIEYGPTTDPARYAQNAVTGISTTQPGRSYTFVARVLNTSLDNVTAKVSFIGDVPIPKRANWQTVVVPFTAFAATTYVGFNNRAPEDGDHLLVDHIAVYEGSTSGFNGEVFRYAPFSWMHARVRPMLVIEGHSITPLGVFIPSAPVEHWDEGGGRQEIELLDRTSILSQDAVPRTYTVAKGANIISTVRDLIRSTGERPGAITQSDETLTFAMTWEAGTSKLTIVNELLEAAGFFPLWSDAFGQFRVEEYRRPRQRPVSYRFRDGNDSIYLPGISVDRDVYSIPNRVVMTSQGGGEEEAWTVIVTNEDESSPFSFQRRGRWITDVQKGVEATSAENLQRKAEQRLNELTAVQTSIEVTHAPLPDLAVNDVVRFRRKPADVDSLFVVTATSIDFNPTALQRTSIREVVNVG